MSALEILDDILQHVEVDRYPLVSIVLPMYNAQNYICSAVESIINQTYLNCELIIIDDRSTDNPSDIVQQKYVLQYSNIRLISLQQNSGIVNALKKGSV